MSDVSNFFEDVKKKVSETVDLAVKRTGAAVEVSKIRSEIRTLEKSNERDYSDIGKMVFEKFKQGNIPDESLIPFCTEIEGREATISEYQLEIERVKEK